MEEEGVVRVPKPKLRALCKQTPNGVSGPLQPSPYVELAHQQQQQRGSTQRGGAHFRFAGGQAKLSPTQQLLDQRLIKLL